MVSTIHIDEVLRVPGFSSCQRFQVSDVQREGSALPAQKYLNVFELVTDDPIKAMADLREAMSSMRLSDAVDYASVSSVIYEAA